MKINENAKDIKNSLDELTPVNKNIKINENAKENQLLLHLSSIAFNPP